MKPKKTLILIVILVVLLSAVGLISRYDKKAVAPTAPDYGVPTATPPAQYPAKFSKNLIVNNSLQLEQASQTNYKEGTLSVVQLSDSQSVSATNNAYLKFFADNKFTIINKTSRTGFANIYARKGKEEVLVVIETKNGKVEVTINDMILQ